LRLILSGNNSGLSGDLSSVLMLLMLLLLLLLLFDDLLSLNLLSEEVELFPRLSYSRCFVRT